jgi:signal transduction histidine kinase
MKRKLRKVALRVLPVSAVVLAWGFLGMLYFEAFFPPLEGFGKWLTPWSQLFSSEAGSSLKERMLYMAGLFDRSVVVGNLGMVMMVASFVALVVYASTVIQQKQRRARENELLVMKNMEIARRNEFIRYISATIGHEFKNNLGRIKRRLALLDLPDTARINIDGNLEKLFADINIFKRISDEREAGIVYFEKTDLVRMIDSVASQYADLMEFSSRIELDNPVIFSARTLLRTVFENLFDNAVKYKKPEQEKARVSLACNMDMDGVRRYVSLYFRDEGVGMDEQQADICFYKGMGSGEGWGEGLYFSKYVVGLHAGKIKIGKEYTSPGVGTEVIINLPFVEETMDV